MMPTLALTIGEPAGIGPDLVCRLAMQPRQTRVVAIGDAGLLADRAAMLGLPARFAAYDPAAPAPAAGVLEVCHVPLAVPAVAGRLDPANGPAMLAMLDRAIDGCLAGEFAAMVTAPLHKGVINEAGVAFTGHTEYLAERTGTPLVVMMLAGAGMRVALVTTHLPLRAVADAIDRKSVV